MDFKKRFLLLILVLFVVFLTGVIGYEIIECWNFLDSAFMTIITLATVGYGETHPLSNAGRIFTILLIMGGMGVVSYTVITVTTLIAEGELQRFLRRGRMDKEISKLDHHYIICGVGETGKHIIQELIHTKREFVAIDNNIKKIDEKNILYIEGDASSDTVLINAGIERAKGIFCTLPMDKDNLFVVLTARELNENIRIVTKCIEDESEQKFLRAGANKTISPTYIGGLRMASEMIRPTVASFLDVMLRDKKGVRFEEVAISQISKLVNKTIAEIEILEKTGVIVVAIKNNKGEYLYNPRGNTKINVKDTLIILGDVEQIRNLISLV
ncbi:MAG: potassium channel protein [Candidatus Firestonebacteria bacterium]